MYRHRYRNLRGQNKTPEALKCFGCQFFVRDAGLADSIFICFLSKNRYKKTTRLLFLCMPCVEPIKKCGYFSLCVLWSSPKIRSSMSGRSGFCGIESLLIVSYLLLNFTLYFIIARYSKIANQIPVKLHKFHKR